MTVIKMKNVLKNAHVAIILCVRCEIIICECMCAQKQEKTTIIYYYIYVFYGGAARKWLI